MIIATSHDDNCIRSLINLLEKQYPGMPFEMRMVNISLIEIHDDEIESWENTNPGIFDKMLEFVSGYTIGWDNALNN